MLGLWSYAYAYAYDDPYVAGLTSFLCFAFCFALMLMLSCEPGLTNMWGKPHIIVYLLILTNTICYAAYIVLHLRHNQRNET